MLRSVKDLTTYPIRALDGAVGTAKDVLFDDSTWTLRYLVVDTGSWLPGRKVLISPLDMGKPEVGQPENHFRVRLTKKQIEDSPHISTDQPISRQFEKEYATYYNHGIFWFHPNPKAEAAAGDPGQNALEHARRVNDIKASNLRSANEVTGYRIKADDGQLGHVEDFIMDDRSWMIRFFVVDSRNWLPDKKFLMDINWLECIDWATELASVALTKEAIKSSPEYDPNDPVNADYLNRLYDYYGKAIPKEYMEPAATTF